MLSVICHKAEYQIAPRNSCVSPRCVKARSVPILNSVRPLARQLPLDQTKTAHASLTIETASTPSISPPATASKDKLTADNTHHCPFSRSRSKTRSESQLHSAQCKPRGFPWAAAARKYSSRRDISFRRNPPINLLILKPLNTLLMIRRGNQTELPPISETPYSARYHVHQSAEHRPSV